MIVFCRIPTSRKLKIKFNKLHSYWVHTFYICFQTEGCFYEKRNERVCYSRLQQKGKFILKASRHNSEKGRTRLVINKKLSVYMLISDYVESIGCFSRFVRNLLSKKWRTITLFVQCIHLLMKYWNLPLYCCLWSINIKQRSYTSNPSILIINICSTWMKAVVKKQRGFETILNFDD